MRTGPAAREHKTSLEDLPAAAWISLAEPKLERLGQRDLVLGVFLAFDRTPDLKGARRLLDKAASNGADVAVWLKRIDAGEEEKKAQRAAIKKEKDDNVDPLLGRWRIVIGKGKHADAVNVEFKKDGKVLPANGKWQLDGAGQYRWTNAKGGTVTFKVSGDELTGHTVKGMKVRGTKQASKEK